MLRIDLKSNLVKSRENILLIPSASLDAPFAVVTPANIALAAELIEFSALQICPWIPDIADSTQLVMESSISCTKSIT